MAYSQIKTTAVQAAPWWFPNPPFLSSPYVAVILNQLSVQFPERQTLKTYPATIK